MSARGRRNRTWVAEVHAWGAASSAEHLAQELEAFASAPDLRPDVAALDIPILLRVGTAETASPPARSRRILAVAKACVLEEVPGVGHAILCEDFDATAESIDQFLEAASRRQGVDQTAPHGDER